MVNKISLSEGHSDPVQPDTAHLQEETVPLGIREAGPEAVESYLTFLDRPLTHHVRYNSRCATNHFFCWCADNGLVLKALRTEHANQFLTAKLNIWKPSTARVYIYSIRQLFNQFVSDHVIEHSPFAGVKPPSAFKPELKPGTLEALKVLLYTLDGINEESNYYAPGLVALYPLVIGSMNLDEIACTTQLPLSEVELYAGRLRKNGIWTSDERVVVDFEDGEKEPRLAVMNLVLIIGCAAGDFEYVPANAEADGSSLCSPSSDDSDP